MLDRRTFLAGAAAVLACSDTVLAHARRLDRKWRRQIIDDPTGVRPGTIVVDPRARFLYLALGDDLALRYGVAVGREGFAWSGSARIGRKAEWPIWTPPQSMIEREPKLARWADGMPGGPNNPLGARALYLYRGKRDTLYRIHGTNEPWTIGQAVSSGCIRLTNDDIVDLYERVPIGTPVVVLSA